VEQKFQKITTTNDDIIIMRNKPLHQSKFRTVTT